MGILNININNSILEQDKDNKFLTIKEKKELLLKKKEIPICVKETKEKQGIVPYYSTHIKQKKFKI